MKTLKCISLILSISNRLFVSFILCIKLVESFNLKLVNLLEEKKQLNSENLSIFFSKIKLNIDINISKMLLKLLIHSFISYLNLKKNGKKRADSIFLYCSIVFGLSKKTWSFLTHSSISWITIKRFWNGFGPYVDRFSVDYVFFLFLFFVCLSVQQQTMLII